MGMESIQVSGWGGGNEKLLAAADTSNSNIQKIFLKDIMMAITIYIMATPT